MKKALKIAAVLLCSALVLCSCGKKDKSESSSDKNNMEISTTVPNDVYVVAPDVIYYDEDGNIIESTVIESTVSATDSQYIEINPFEGWDITEIFSRSEDGKIEGNNLPDGFYYGENFKKMYKNKISGEIRLYTKDGELITTRVIPVPENETLIAKFSLRRCFTNPEEAKPEEIAPDEEVLEYAKERGILLTELSREVVVKVPEETEK